MTDEVKAKSWFSMRVIRADDDGDMDADVDPNMTQPVDGKSGEIMVYDEIGAYGVSAAAFDQALKSLGDVDNITMRVNSPGGDSFAGVAIHNTLARHPAKITAHVDGLAASAASLITMAADKIVMPENSFMVVHNPHALTMGPASVHRAMADDLDRVTDSYANCYAARTGQTIENVKALMDEDRLMGAKECMDKGYCDSCVPPTKMAATFALDKVPAKHRDMIASVMAPVPPVVPALPGPPDGIVQGMEPKFPVDPITIVSTTATPLLTLVADVGADHDKLVSAIKTLEPVAPDANEVLDLCALAGATIAKAQEFIRAKTPIADVRKALLEAKASAADARQIVPARTSDGGQSDGSSSSSIISNKRRLQKIIKLADAEKISEHEATLRVEAEERRA